MNNTTEKAKLFNYLIDNLEKNSDFDECLEKALNNLKIKSKSKEIFFYELFKNGVDSLIFELNNFINEKMKKDVPKNFSKFRINEKIRFLIIHRIKIIDTYFNKQKVIKLILKQKSFLKLNKMLFNISDEMWFMSGDKSTDFNFYSKRFILMNIYSLSFIYNLKNASKDYSDTKKFVDKQIDSVLRFGRIKNKIQDTLYPKSM